MRFEGLMNVDISDIVTNLLPFPSMNYILAGMAPLYNVKDVRHESEKY